MAKHPKTVQGFKGNLDQLVESILDSGLPTTKKFVEKLALDIEKQGDGDKARGRQKLSSQLYTCAQHLYQARDELEVLVQNQYYQGRNYNKTEKDIVKGFHGSLEDLAKAIGNMTYDQTSLFLEKFSSYLKEQAIEYVSKDKAEYSSQFLFCAQKVHLAKEHMDLAWKICKPYMK